MRKLTDFIIMRIQYFRHSTKFMFYMSGPKEVGTYVKIGMIIKLIKLNETLKQNVNYVLPLVKHRLNVTDEI